MAAVMGGRLRSEGADTMFYGLQLGGGAEVKLTRQWSLRAEYTYTDFRRETVGPAGITTSVDPSHHAVQAAITYRF